MTVPDPHQVSSDGCRVVRGADAVVSVRRDEPDSPLVALTDPAAPLDAVFAQAAGADAVLPVPPHVGGDVAPVDLGLAVRAARTTARRRADVARSSRRATHDVAQALNVIALAADVGRQGRLDPDEVLDQISRLARDAGADAWRAGHAGRSAARVTTCVEVGSLLRSVSVGADVEIVTPVHETFVLADERELARSIDELVGNARRAGAARIRIETMASADHQSVAILVSDDGTGFPTELRTTIGEPFTAAPDSGRLGLGLAVVAEYVAELGGALELVAPGGDGRRTQVELSLPTTTGPATGTAAQAAPTDQATAQADILEGVVRHAPLADSLEAIVAAIEQQLPGTVCSVLLLDDGRSLHHEAGERLPPAYREAIDGVEIGRGQGSCGTAAYLGRPVVATDVTIDENWTDFRDVATAHGLRSCWSTPIAADGGEVLGTFAVYTDTVWRPDEAAIRLVNRFTYLTAVAIEHHRLYGALAESEARFRSAFEGAAAGIALISLTGSIFKVNPALSELVDRPAPGLVGSNLLDLLAPSHHTQVRQLWRQLTAADSAAPRLRSVDVPLRTSGEGPQVWLSLHTSLISGEPDRSPYLYVEVRDITAARRQLDDLRAREAAEAANRAKTDFLALASHELRTPLNAILGFAQVMQLIDLDARQRSKSVDQIVKAGRHLRDLINELLDLSRIESGQLTVEAEDVDTRGIVGEAMELVRPLASSCDIALVDGTISGSIPHVVADRRCMRQVLINLLDNAVKYTPERGRVDVAVTPSASGSVRIAVTDSGPGISPASLDEVFQPFHRLDQDSDEEHEGTGLGLALCARLMREMGGSIGVTSAIGAGSCFWIELPASPGSAPPAVDLRSDVTDQLAPADTPAPTSPAVVLYVEDDPASVEVMAAALSLRAHTLLRTATSASEGLDALAAGGVDLVLLDVGLPDRSGWDLLTEIRSMWPGLPVIVLTAGPGTAPDGVPEPDRVFTKPLDIPDALRAVDVGLARTAGGGLTETVDAIDQ